MSALGVLNGDPSTPTPINVAAVAKTIPETGPRLSGRRVVIIQPLDGDIYWAYGTSVSTTSGFLLRQEAILQLEASDLLIVSIIASSGTVNVRTQEVG